MDWVVLYKVGRLALLAAVLTAIAVYVYGRSRRERMEEPARRMLEEDDA